jgi:hypothetical protein
MHVVEMGIFITYGSVAVQIAKERWVDDLVANECHVDVI